jgi:hypothetical protein
MTRHVASTRHFPASPAMVTLSWPRPLPGGTLVMAPLPAGLNGQPYNGMDPSAPATWVRPWNPQPGMVAYLNFDGAKAQADTPTGGVWRNPQRDRWLPRRPMWRRK